MSTKYPLPLASARKRKLLSLQHIQDLLAQADAEVKSTPTDLEEANQLARKAGFSIHSELPAILKSHKNGTAAAVAFTGGHSNTDHVVLMTGDYVTDRIAELRRNLLTRSRAQQPESKGEEKWDKPRIPGERRRRIVREKDLPAAPPEPGQSGYVIFVGQMTTKIRHDRPNEPHIQTRVVQEISKMWRMGLTDEDRKYYNDFADEVRKEYKKQHMEFRATGSYTPSDTFEKVEGCGLWLRKKWSEKNALEREIASYDTYVFPPRPADMNDEYQRRFLESVERRKAKLRSQAYEAAERKRKQEEHQEVQSTDDSSKRRRVLSSKVTGLEATAKSQGSEKNDECARSVDATENLVA